MILDLFHPPHYAVWEEPLAHATVELDLGCGPGTFFAHLAKRYPDRFCIAVDQMRTRVRRTHKRVEKAKLTNTAVLATTGWDVVGFRFPDQCLDRVHILCPDPWPKDRHECKRLLSTEFLARLACKLKPGGILHFSTDDVPYYDFVDRTISPLTRFVPCPEGIADVLDIKTDFERLWHSKGLPVRHRGWRLVP